MKPTLTLIPTLSINPHQISFYNQVCWHPYKPLYNKPVKDSKERINVSNSFINSKRIAAGNVSKIAKRKLGRAVDYLLLMADDKYINKQITGRAFNFKVAFITLTLPSKQVHSDNEIKRKCLNSFLIEIERYHKVKRYVWRAELQKNGNIHFHILIDKFVHWNDIRNRWNRIINKLGYVDRYREKMKEFYRSGFVVREDLLKNWPIEKQRANYKANKLTDYHNPNSTDIHSLKKIRNIKFYLIKYMSKNEIESKSVVSGVAGKRIQQGRVWSASRSLLNLKGCQIPIDTEIEKEIISVVEKSGCKTFDSEYYSIFIISLQEVLSFGGDKLFKYFSDYLLDTFDYSIQKPMLL